MPLITDEGLDSFLKIVLWRGLFMFSVTVTTTSVTTYPLWSLANEPLPIYLKVLWIVAGACALLSGQRWYHWRRVQKNSIFNEDGTLYSNLKRRSCIKL